MNAWYEAGLVWPDSTWSAYSGPEEDIFARVCRASELAPAAADRYRVKICNTMFTAAKSVNGYFAIPAGVKNPCMVLQVLNLFYAKKTAGEWANLMVYGQAGTDYLVGEDGRYTASESETAYRNVPLGCNPLFLGEWDTEEPGTRLTQTQALAGMRRSNYYGCTVDASDYTQLKRPLRIIASQYIPLVSWGGIAVIWKDINPFTNDSRAGDFQDALPEAGLAEYMKLYQDRVSQWLAQ